MVCGKKKTGGSVQVKTAFLPGRIPDGQAAVAIFEAGTIICGRPEAGEAGLLHHCLKTGARVEPTLAVTRIFGVRIVMTVGGKDNPHHVVVFKHWIGLKPGG